MGSRGGFETPTPFASNVNIAIQSISMTLDPYREVTFREFKANGLTVLADTRKKVSKRDALLIEYEETLGSRALHFLALAIIDKKKVYLVTCTTPKTEFKDLEKEFRRCQDSFVLTE